MQVSEITLIALVAVIGAMVLLQVIFMVATAIAVRKGMKVVQEQVNEVSASVGPFLRESREFIHQTKELVNRLEPKIESACEDLAEITRTTRTQVTKMQVSAEEISERVRRQAERVDHMATSTLNGVDRVGHFISDAVSAPVRQVSGIMAAARAVVDTLRSPGPARHARPAPVPAPVVVEEYKVEERKNVVA